MYSSIGYKNEKKEEETQTWHLNNYALIGKVYTVATLWAFADKVYAPAQNRTRTQKYTYKCKSRTDSVPNAQSYACVITWCFQSRCQENKSKIQILNRNWWNKAVRCSTNKPTNRTFLDKTSSLSVTLLWPVKKLQTCTQFNFNVLILSWDTAAKSPRCELLHQFEFNSTARAEIPACEGNDAMEWANKKLCFVSLPLKRSHRFAQLPLLVH